MKKLFPLLITAVVLLLSCSKDNAAGKINGNFTQSSLNTFELYTDPEDTGSCIGNCTIRNTTTLSFDGRSSYSLRITQNLESCVLDENASYTQSDLEPYFKNNLTIQGFYKATSTQITLSNVKVVGEDGIEFPFDEYLTKDPTIGDKVQTVEYEYSDDTLTLLLNNNSITYFKK